MNPMNMMMVVLWVLMMTIFRISLLCVFLLILSYEVYPKTVLIKVNGTDVSFTDAEAQIESYKIIRSDAWRAYNISGRNEDDLQKCWNHFIVNKKLNFSIKNSELRIFKANQSSIEYEYKYDPKKINIKGSSKANYLKFCDLKINDQDNDDISSETIRLDFEEDL
jgi:hypothetical protein